MRATTTEDAQDTLVVGRAVSADPVDVWRSLTVDRHRWWPDMSFDAVEGSSLRETWTEAGRTLVAEGRVTDVVAAETLGFEWWTPPDTTRLQVRVTIRAHEAGSRVCVSERGFLQFADADTLRSDHLRGWEYHLDRLCRDVVRHA